MFDRLGRLVTRYWPWVILAWIAFAVAINVVAPRWDDITYDGDLAYLPSRMTSVRGEQLLAEAFPDYRARSQMAIVVERPDGPLTDADFDVVDALVLHFESAVSEQASEETQLSQVAARQGVQTALPLVEMWNYDSEVVGARLASRVSQAGQATLLVLHLSNEFMATHNIEVLSYVQQAIDEARSASDFPAGLQLAITGSAAVGGDMLASAQESIANTELTTVVLVVAILLLVYRAPLLVVIPLTAIIISVLSAMDLIAIASGISAQVDWIHFKVFKTTKIFIVTILFGSGTDYCLFLIARYREELSRGLDRAQALKVTVSQVGNALAASAMTTICGLGMMYFADFGKFRYSGPVIAVCLAVCLFACLTLAPAMLYGLGNAVFWPFQKPLQLAEHGPGSRGWRARFWQSAADGILRRPGLILVTSVALMIYPAIQGWSVPISYNLVNELESSRASVIGTNMLRRHFSPGDMGPVTVLAHLPGGAFDTKEGEQEIARLTKILYDLEGVESVRSYAEPLGDKPGLFNPLSTHGRRKMAAKRHPRTVAMYLSHAPEWQGDVTRFDVVLDADPFSERATQTLNDIDVQLAAMAKDADSPWYGAEFDLVGTTAGKRDLQAVIESDQTRIMQLVTIAVLAVILLLLRRPVICAYLILSVIFSYLVTIGSTELFFSWLYAGSFEGLDWKVPIFLFVILVAIGQDYNIYLVTRVFEEQERYAPLVGLRRAIVQTGGIITSCGVIMAGSFMSMLTGNLRGILELGFALTLGIALDTFVVRPVLVPAFLALYYKLQGHRLPEAEPQVPHDMAPRLIPHRESPALQFEQPVA